MTSTPTGEKVAPELEQFYTQELHWEKEDNGTDRAMVTVPLDWQNPEGDTIQIAIARQATAGTPKGSLLLNPGGPGGSGIDFLLNGGNDIVTSPVRDGFDLVGFDPRGVGRSNAISCFSGDAERENWARKTDGVATGTPEWEQEVTEQANTFASSCRINGGPVVEHVDSVSAARDMDVIRALLGDKKINYLGFSYGSYLGTVYAEQYPDKVGRMVLDGGIGPDGFSTDFEVRQAEGFEEAFTAYLNDCVKGEDCPFTGNVVEARAQAHKAIASVEGKRLKGEDGRILDAETLATATISNLYDEESWPLISEIFLAVKEGDPTWAFNSADGFGLEDPYTAIRCSDRPVGEKSTSPSEMLDRIRKASPTLKAFGTNTASLCAKWPYANAQRVMNHAKGADDILVIGTTGDPATPYQDAVALADYLDSGKLVTYDAEGHTAYRRNDCVNRAVEEYLLARRVPTTDPQCA